MRRCRDTDHGRWASAGYRARWRFHGGIPAHRHEWVPSPFPNLVAGERPFRWRCPIDVERGGGAGIGGIEFNFVSRKVLFTSR